MLDGALGELPDTVSATVLVDARLPQASVTASADPLLRHLTGRGELRELAGGKLVVDPEQRLVHADGTVHPRRFAVGPWVAGGGWAAAFARPGLDAGFFRLNDRVARAVLQLGTVSVVGPRAASSAPSRRTTGVR